MRPLVRLPLAALVSCALVVTPALLGTGAASAADRASVAERTAAPRSDDARPKVAKPARPRPQAGKPGQRPQADKPAQRPKADKPARPRGVKARVVVVGAVSATRTVTVGQGTAVLVTLRARGGDKEYRGRLVEVTVLPRTAVRRSGPRAQAGVQLGDTLLVHARRTADGTLLATHVVATGRPRPVTSPPSATSTATATVTTTARSAG